MVANEANAATTLAWLNNPATRVFCIEPGDYRSLGMLDLTLSGTQANRRYLRFDAPKCYTSGSAVPEPGAALLGSACVASLAALAARRRGGARRVRARVPLRR